MTTLIITAAIIAAIASWVIWHVRDVEIGPDDDHPIMGDDYLARLRRDEMEGE